MEDSAKRTLDAPVKSTYHPSSTSADYYNLFSLHAEQRILVIGLTVSLKSEQQKAEIFLPT
jgi:hypothetical protein